MKRRFVRFSLVFVFISVLLVLQSLSIAQTNQAYPFTFHNGYIALLTDLHYPYKSKTVEKLLGEIAEIKPQAVFLLGDLTEIGSDEEFNKLHETLLILERAKIPYRYILGNHDVRWSYQIRKTKRLDINNSAGLYETFTYEVGDFVVIGIGTTMLFQHVGHIGEIQLKWLKQELERSKSKGKQVILLSHHPFGGPNNYTDDGWKVLEMLPDYDVPLVLSGHVHKYDHSGFYNWAWFQTVGAAKDGYMTVLSWDNEQAYLWKYDVSTDGFEILKSVPLKKQKRQLVNGTITLVKNADGTVKIKVEGVGAERIRIIANGKVIHERALQNTSEKPSTYEVTLNNLPKVDISVLLRVSLIGKEGVFQKFFVLEQQQKGWSFQLEDTIYSKPAVLEGGFVIADYSGNVVFLKDGKAFWKKKIGSVVANIETISGNFVLGALDGNLYLFDVNGNLLKQVKLSEPIHAIKKGNSTLAVCAGKYFYILKATDLTVIAKHDLKGLLEIQPLFENGKYYQPSWDGKIYIVSEDGKLIDQFEVGKSYYTSGSSIPAIVGNLLIYANIEGTVNAMDVQTKGKIWSLKIPGVGYSSVKRQGDFVYVTTMNGEVYKIGAKTGKIIWNVKLNSSTMVADPIILDQKQLVLGTDRGEVAFVDLDSGNYDMIFAGTGYLTSLLPFENNVLCTFANGVVRYLHL
ncbi:PQQ-like domain-containing protein [Fervidobacterium changbaicum]|uniref:PQQ-binding-like beta-propeller repeat protein n=2 Tax=Fervidobacterium TaxID=2422 RepID=A0AAI8GDN6_FERIS|nr:MULTISPECIES: PQQ-binding-like beta-propeller repeat protein [Fervidobacterium]AMW33204.1 PQQ-binding-like beta-propeller repeat protein [Fervidobacterium islandicum]QAV33266.1 hypothetical protein CBS1_05710 [Fervidobacterium changbaicum]SDH06592.1 PQQ-like domain-containing protein [Fervidobacterium changbaicum]